MKVLNYILIITISALLLSCETEIDLDLKSAEPRLVIDANIAEGATCYVLLSMTKDYWDQEEIPYGVDGATITLSDSKSNPEVLQPTGNKGVYTSSRIKGKVGNTYTLTVSLEGKTYIATEKIPVPVPIHHIRTYKMDTGGDSYYYPCISFRDPADVENYYLYVMELNGRPLQKKKVDDDKNSNGKLKEPILFFDNKDDEIQVGDYVRVELQSVSFGAYNYYKTITPPGGVQNSNPISNFSGNVLGLFKAYSSSTIDMTITEEDLQ